MPIGGKPGGGIEKSTSMGFLLYWCLFSCVMTAIPEPDDDEGMFCGPSPLGPRSPPGGGPDAGGGIDVFGAPGGGIEVLFTTVGSLFGAAAPTVGMLLLLGTEWSGLICMFALADAPGWIAIAPVSALRILCWRLQ